MKIYSAKNPTQAHILRGLLETQGIDVEVRGDGIFGLKGEIPMTCDTDPYLWLHNPNQHAKARQLIKEYEEAYSVDDKPWQCKQCDEFIDGNFGVCWQCGASKIE